jgi:hypothetical protein
VQSAPTTRLPMTDARLAHERLDRTDVLGKSVLVP